MIKPIPKETLEYNEVYLFKTGENFQYKTSVVIDGLNDNLLLMPWHMPEVSETSFCTCQGFKFKKNKCKHMSEIIEYLKSVGINIREEPKPNNELSN